MRGEHQAGVNESASQLGSSPRARGAPGRARPLGAQEGIIPACAGSTSRTSSPACSRRDHPRVRGEHTPVEPVKPVIEGSSPRARGALSRPSAHPRSTGIIPACAGSTAWSAGRRRPLWDHPRVRGEHPASTLEAVWLAGSSPRARGAPAPALLIDDPLGIIPACAGSTWHHPPLGDPPGDHPRVRGEHMRRCAGLQGYSGSSPRARGARRLAAADPAARGIIPACAGSTRRSSRQGGTWRDHPRVRGEHTRDDRLRKRQRGSSPRARGARSRPYGERAGVGIIPACAGSTPAPDLGDREAAGSSPRARGARRRARPATRRRGIIPACAGSTVCSRCSASRCRDHPRVRGEHSMPRLTASSEKGSSPRARGARELGAQCPKDVGIIPACAGSTRHVVLARGDMGDHPRVRGEHTASGYTVSTWSGSSPRARGARLPRRPQQVAHGIIPACAGSTSAPTVVDPMAGDHPRVRGEHHADVSAFISSLGSSPRARGAPACSQELV